MGSNMRWAREIAINHATPADAWINESAKAWTTAQGLAKKALEFSYLRDEYDSGQGGICNLEHVSATGILGMGQGSDLHGSSRVRPCFHLEAYVSSVFNVIS